MYLKYGSYSHPLNEAAVVISVDPMMTDELVPYAQKIKWTITGYLQADSQGAITSAIQALEAAYAIQGQNAGIYLDDSTPTAHILTSNQMIGGVRVQGVVNYPDGSGAEYTTFRHYQIHIEAIKPTKQVNLIEYNETLAFTGTGGPRVIYIEVRNGPPQQQVVSQATACEVRQSGRAVGVFSYPPYPRPIWPAAELVEQRRLTPKTPEYTGSGAFRSATRWPFEWSYTFKSASPLTGVPTLRAVD